MLGAVAGCRPPEWAEGTGGHPAPPRLHGRSMTAIAGQGGVGSHDPPELKAPMCALQARYTRWKSYCLHTHPVYQRASLARRTRRLTLRLRPKVWEPRSDLRPRRLPEEVIFHCLGMLDLVDMRQVDAPPLRHAPATRLLKGADAFRQPHLRRPSLAEDQSCFGAVVKPGSPSAVTGQPPAVIGENLSVTSTRRLGGANRCRLSQLGNRQLSAIAQPPLVTAPGLLVDCRRVHHLLVKCYSFFFHCQGLLGTAPPVQTRTHATPEPGCRTGGAAAVGQRCVGREIEAGEVSGAPKGHWGCANGTEERFQVRLQERLLAVRKAVGGASADASKTVEGVGKCGRGGVRGGGVGDWLPLPGHRIAEGIGERERRPCLVAHLLYCGQG